MAAIARFEVALLEHVKTSDASILEDIKTNKTLDKDLEARMGAAIEAFKKGFSA